MLALLRENCSRVLKEILALNISWGMLSHWWCAGLNLVMAELRGSGIRWSFGGGLAHPQSLRRGFFFPDMREFGPNQVFIYVCLIAHQLLTILSQIKNIQIIYFEVKPVSLRIFSMPWKAWKFQEQCCQSITIQNLQILDSTQFSKLKSKSIKVNNKSSSAKTIDGTAMSPKLSEVVRLWQT